MGKPLFILMDIHITCKVFFCEKGIFPFFAQGKKNTFTYAIKSCNGAKND